MDLQGAFHVYDTTLRDGAQQEGLNLSVADKLTIARQLDELGVGYIEGGWPGANPKDTEFFARARDELDLRHARLTAFGATRRAGVRAADDPLIAALRDSGATVVTLVAKSHPRHVELALRTTLAENLEMVRDTVAHLTAEGQQVFLDAEHFFDGYKANAAFSKRILRAAEEAGTETLVLCDTNGGALPHEVEHVAGDQPRAVQFHRHMRVDPLDGRGCAFDLGHADIGGAVDHLALQVGERDCVVIDDTQRPDAGSGEIEQHRRAQSAGADHEHTRALERGLARPADLAEHDVAGIAFKFCGIEHGGL